MRRGRGAGPPWLRLAATAEPGGSAGADPGAADLVDLPAADLVAIHHTDQIFEALAHRRTGRTDPDDPAVRLLNDLVADVDVEAPPPHDHDGRPGDPGPRPPRPPRRGGPRTIVALGVVSVVLGTTGVAAAGHDFVNRFTPGASAPESGDGQGARRLPEPRDARDEADHLSDGEPGPLVDPGPRERAAGDPPGRGRSERPGLGLAKQRPGHLKGPFSSSERSRRTLKAPDGLNGDDEDDDGGAGRADRAEGSLQGALRPGLGPKADPSEDGQGRRAERRRNDRARGNGAARSGDDER